MTGRIPVLLIDYSAGRGVEGGFVSDRGILLAHCPA